jgi:hypothetical protein
MSIKKEHPIKVRVTFASWSSGSGKKLMPIILWLLGVPLVVIVLLYLLHVI